MDSYKLEYEETPFKPSKTVGRTKMAKSNNQEQSAPRKKYAKTRGEHFKDLVIAVLVASIIAFIGGMQFANGQNDRVNTAVDQAETAMTAEAVEQPVKK